MGCKLRASFCLLQLQLLLQLQQQQESVVIVEGQGGEIGTDKENALLACWGKPCVTSRGSSRFVLLSLHHSYAFTFMAQQRLIHFRPHAPAIPPPFAPLDQTRAPAISL